VRQLSARQAAACETATSKRCKCRCGGAYHGAARVTEDELGLLATDDPHRAGAPAPVQLTISEVDGAGVRWTLVTDVETAGA